MIFIPGAPAPQGSAKAFVVGKSRPRAVVTHDNAKTVPWRDSIRAAIDVDAIAHPAGPVTVRCEFVMPRRKAEPKRSTPAHTRKPDTDKLCRAVLDALTGLVYTDDSQVVLIVASKRTAEIGERPGLWLDWDADSRPRCECQSDANPENVPSYQEAS